MPSQVQGWPWPHERAVRAAVGKHWGLRDGSRLPMHEIAPAVIGEFLGRLHFMVRGCPSAGGWTPGDVLGHMTRGITAPHPPSSRRMINQAVSDVSAYYGTAPPVQLRRAFSQAP
jgi:hypothetical protein